MRGRECNVNKKPVSVRTETKTLETLLSPSYLHDKETMARRDSQMWHEEKRLPVSSSNPSMPLTLVNWQRHLNIIDIFSRSSFPSPAPTVFQDGYFSGHLRLPCSWLTGIHPYPTSHASHLGLLCCSWWCEYLLCWNRVTRISSGISD